MDEGEAWAGAQVRRKDCILRGTGGVPGRTEAAGEGHQPPPDGQEKRQQHGRSRYPLPAANWQPCIPFGLRQSVGGLGTRPGGGGLCFGLAADRQECLGIDLPASPV
jgi:hypothetical protein